MGTVTSPKALPSPKLESELLHDAEYMQSDRRPSIIIHPSGFSRYCQSVCESVCVSGVPGEALVCVACLTTSVAQFIPHSEPTDPEKKMLSYQNKQSDE